MDVNRTVILQTVSSALTGIDRHEAPPIMDASSEQEKNKDRNQFFGLAHDLARQSFFNKSLVGLGGCFLAILPSHFLKR